jgi:hypothetical protein
MSIENLMGKLRGEYSEPVLIELFVGADDKNSSINILQVRKKLKKSLGTFSIYFHLSYRHLPISLRSWIS